MIPDEAFYDEEIAPVLIALGRKCEARNIPFLAVVQFDPETVGRTEFRGSSPNAEMALASLGARCGGNADILITGLLTYGREHGHNSAFLHILERKP